MIRGPAANITRLRRMFLEKTGAEWRGTDHLLRVLTRSSQTLTQIQDAMVRYDSSDLPDDPRLRPLGMVSDMDLLAEIEKRPKLFD